MNEDTIATAIIEELDERQIPILMATKGLGKAFASHCARNHLSTEIFLDELNHIGLYYKKLNRFYENTKKITDGKNDKIDPKN